LTNGVLQVVFLADGSMIPNWSIEASHIMSLDLVEAKAAKEPPSPLPQQAEFNDPAIVSVSILDVESCVLSLTVLAKAS